MARAKFVKKARKNYPNAGIKKGESYYWWKFRYGGKHYSKTPPKPSQLTQSEFWSAVYSAQESAEDVPAFDDLASQRDDIVSELENTRDETQGKFDNMPEGLQQGDTGQMLEERVNALDEVISALQDVDCEPEIDEEEDAPGEDDEKETDEQKNERLDRVREEKAQEVWQEVTDALGNISCS